MDYQKRVYEASGRLISAWMKDELLHMHPECCAVAHITNGHYSESRDMNIELLERMAFTLDYEANELNKIENSFENFGDKRPMIRTGKYLNRRFSHGFAPCEIASFDTLNNVINKIIELNQKFFDAGKIDLLDESIYAKVL